ncbi:MAG: class I SAM-dependent methyltransferase [Candidatus Nanopelagicales bacterium]
MPTTESTPPVERSYFGMQASWGVTKHPGGLHATDELAARCQVTERSRVLVVGCGIGVTPCHLALRRGCHVVGVDLSEQMVEWSRRRVERRGLGGRVELAVADARDLPFDDGRFDAVLVESVNAFIPDVERAFAQYARVVRPGGFVGINEGTWVRYPPPPELVAFIQRTMGSTFRTSQEWVDLLGGPGLEGLAATTHGMTALRQRLDENAGLDATDWVDRLRAVGSFVRSLATDPGMRSYAREITPSRQVMRDLFKYFGYGLYAARRPLLG